VVDMLCTAYYQWTVQLTRDGEASADKCGCPLWKARQQPYMMPLAVSWERA
jgi:hypothetical protein